MTDVCAVRGCDHGWVTVLPSYADRHAPMPPPADVWDRMTPVEQERWEATRDAVWASLAESIYPCRTCQPDAFYRWCQGHWSVGHDPAGCEICQEAKKGKPRRGDTPVVSSGYEPQPRRDLQ